ncbi:MAG: hypothetical protein AAGI44_15620, partial [Pseudomonadota bacterium]
MTVYVIVAWLTPRNGEGVCSPEQHWLPYAAVNKPGNQQMILFKRLVLIIIALLVLAIVVFNLWGFLTLGTLEPGQGDPYDPRANNVVLVSGANGSVGDGLLKAA